MKKCCTNCTVREVHRLLTLCWGQDTSRHATWDAYCPSYGQEDVTALLVNDEFGGQIVCGTINDIKVHFWNVITLEDGREMIVDLTRGQYAYWTQDQYPEVIEYEELLNFDNVAKRYSILRTRFERIVPK